MTKIKRIYSCQACGAVAHKWSGQCADCLAWNTLEGAPAERSSRGYAGVDLGEMRKMADVELGSVTRKSSSIQEFDRVLGGGLVKGSVVLIGGDPGVGKSTLLLQTLCALASTVKTLYVTGEESLQQVAMRAHNLAIGDSAVQLLAAVQVDHIIAQAEQAKPAVMVIDSIQTLYCPANSAAPGSVSQVRDCAAKLVQFAKKMNVSLFLVGHVTKDGTLAGPRVLEHMVDTVLYFEGQKDARYRMIRAVKNRFGAVNELGIFIMTQQGLKEVKNPSAIFLSAYQRDVPGSGVTISWEGTRPLIVELQALVDQNHSGNPRRVCVGVDMNRLALCLAVLQRHAGIATYDKDVFINVVGGVRVSETSADLTLLLAVISSLHDKPLPHNLVTFGEVGLSGEIRPVPCAGERLSESEKHGFTRAIVPAANVSKQHALSTMEVQGITNLKEAIDWIL